jgi:hypothetical protein
MAGRVGRIIVFFVAGFAGVVLPVALGFVAALVSPPPYVLTGSAVAPEWFAGRDLADGTHVAVKHLSDPDEAVRWAQSRLAQIGPHSLSTDFSGVSWYHDGEGAPAGMILPVANLVVEISGPDDDAVEGALRSLDFVGENPNRGLAWVVQNRLGALFAVLLAYLALLGLAMARLGSWAAATRADPSVAPVSEAELRRRLLAVNQQDVPFKVGPWKGGRLRVEWRLADERWLYLLQENGIKRVERLTLALDSRAHNVRVVESSVYWRRWTGPFAFLASFSGFSGIRFGGVESAKEYGLAYSPADGWWLDRFYEYKFSVAELNAPLAAATLESGWTWKPVVTLVRAIGG